MDVDRIKEYIKLKGVKDQLNGDLKNVNADLHKLEHEILDELTQEGLERVTIDGHNVAASRHVRASAGGNMPGLTRALAAVELTAPMVKQTVNANTLGAWVREFDDPMNPRSAVELRDEIAKEIERYVERKDPQANAAALAAQIIDAISITETFGISLTKARR